MRSLRWIALRALLLFALVLPTFLIAVSIRGDYALASEWLIPSITGSVMALTCFLLQYQRMIPGPAARWRSPSWLENPLARHRPLQWGLFVSEVLMLSGLACASVDMLFVPHHCSWELPIAAGVGVWVGTYLFAKLPAHSSFR